MDQQRADSSSPRVSGALICDPFNTKSIRSIEKHAEDIISFIGDYTLLIDAYLSDYFVLRLWEYVAPTWWDALSDMEPSETASLLNVNQWKARCVWPLSLLAFRATTSALSLPRSRTEISECVLHNFLGGSCIRSETGDHGNIEYMACDDSRADSSQSNKNVQSGCVNMVNGCDKDINKTSYCSKCEKKQAVEGRHLQCETNSVGSTSVKDGQYLILEHCYRRHVKPKKQHEIHILGQVIHSLSRVCNSDHVIDVGAGQGHLSRLLTFGFQLKVTTIEAAGTHAPKALKFDKEVRKDIALGRVGKKRNKGRKLKRESDVQLQVGNIPVEVPEMPNHVVAWIDPSVSVHEFLQRVQLCQLNQRCHKVATGEVNVVNRTTDTNNMNNIVNVEGGNSENGPPGSVVLVGQHSGFSGNICDCCNNKFQNCRGREGQSESLLETNCSLINASNFSVTSQATHSTFSGISSNFSGGKHETVCKLQRDSHKESSYCDQMDKLLDCLPKKSDPELGVKLPGAMSSESRTQTHHALPENIPLNESNQAASTQLNEDGHPVKKANSEEFEAPPFLLTGLHACGDLTPTMLRVFVKCPQAVGLASVACCYMKMSIDDQGLEGRNMAEQPGYPMSSHIQNLPDHQLSYEAREMACHSVDAYFSRLMGDGTSNLRSHCLRSTLEEIIREKDPVNRHPCIKLGVKKSHELPFEEYANLALSKLGLPSGLSKSQLDRASQRLECWQEVVALYTLRLSLGPVLETLILLDRILYLAEHGIYSSLVSVFDPQVSPRNFALLARKTSSADP